MKRKIMIAITLCCLLFASCGNDNKVHIDWNTTKVYRWQDYFSTDEYPFEEDFEQKIELTDFPDTVFIWRTFGIVASIDGEECVLATGMPLWNAFFTDLNSDGFPELCTTVSFGSGIVDNHIVVYDYHNEKEYTLWERMHFDYSLYLDNGELFVLKSPYWNKEGDLEEVGKLQIENDILKFKP